MVGVVGYNSRKCQREGGIGEPLVESRSRRPCGRRGLPQAPGVGGVLANHRVGIIESSVIGGDNIAALFGDWQCRAETIPLLGEQDCHSTPKDPVKLRMA